MFHDPERIQLCTLMNIKSEFPESGSEKRGKLMRERIAGGCLEDCSYCSQSSKHKGTPTKATPLVQLDPVIQAAKEAKANGSTRFCMGAAWRGLEGRKRGFERILDMVREVRGMGMEGEFGGGMTSGAKSGARTNGEKLRTRFERVTTECLRSTARALVDRVVAPARERSRPKDASVERESDSVCHGTRRSDGRAQGVVGRDENRSEKSSASPEIVGRRRHCSRCQLCVSRAP